MTQCYRLFRYLMPCQHLLASQRRAICDVDLHNASAARFLALTPAVCRMETENKGRVIDDDMFRPVQPQEPVKIKVGDRSNICSLFVCVRLKFISPCGVLLLKCILVHVTQKYAVVSLIVLRYVCRQCTWVVLFTYDILSFAIDRWFPTFFCPCTT